MRLLIQLLKFLCYFENVKFTIIAEEWGKIDLLLNYTFKSEFSQIDNIFNFYLEVLFDFKVLSNCFWNSFLD